MSEETVTEDNMQAIDFPQTKNSICTSDTISHKGSTLELFPDELFLELFLFIKPIDLNRGFVNLNQRLNNIINDVCMCIHIVNDDDNINDQACMNYFAYQIIYLAIDCHWSCLSYNISLRPFINLRSLYLPMPSDEQCAEILPDNLPFLTNLTINHNTFKSILCASKSFPYLETCCIPRLYSSILNTMKSVQLCLTLRSLRLCSCSIIELFDMLTYLPNLNYLEIILLSNDQTIRQPYIKHNNLSHLRIKLNKLAPDLEIVLKSMPNLRRLEFLWHEANHWTIEKNFNFEKLANILEENAASVKRVVIDICVSRWDYDMDSIRQLNLLWFSSLSKIRIFHIDAVLITTQNLALNAEENVIMNLFQSTYVTQRHARFNRVKNI